MCNNTCICKFNKVEILIDFTNVNFINQISSIIRIHGEVT